MRSKSTKTVTFDCDPDEEYTVRIPDFTSRFYQNDFLSAMDAGCKRAVIVWHRRCGKEMTCLNWMLKKAWWYRPGGYFYFFPTADLGRKILWDGADKEGKRFLDCIPKGIIESKLKDEMKITLTNGSVIQIMGTNQTITVGTNPVGCVFSEFSLQKSDAWDLVRPILKENEGWAIFNFTPRGKNHAYDLYIMAKNNPKWFCQKLTNDDTGIFSLEDIEEERRSGMSEQLIQQEYYCSFEQGAEGSYYAKLLNKAELENRITNVPTDPHILVDTYWDIGVSDEAVILFVQTCGREIRIIDMYRNSGEGINHYARILKEKAAENEWTYGDHYAPHDIKVREFGSGAQTRLDIAKDLGISFKIVPKLLVPEGIELARGIFPRLWIDSKKCNFFVKAAENYHRHYKEKLNVYSDEPVHDWSSDTMDAFRYLAIMQSKKRNKGMTEEDAERMQSMYQVRY